MNRHGSFQLPWWAQTTVLTTKKQAVFTNLALFFNKEKAMRRATLIISSAIGSLLLCQSAIAAENNAALGLGIGMVPDYEGSEDYKAVPLLYGRYGYGEGSYVMLKGNQLKWNLFNDRIEFGPLLQYRMERDDVDNDQVDDMKDIDAAVEAGFFLTGRSGPYSATLEFASDISDTYNGYLITIGGDYQHHFSEVFKMTFGISTTYASGNYMETYFAVDAGNRGTSTLPDYSADDNEFKDVGFDMSADYRFNDRWSMVGNLGYKILLGDAADSPIVDDEGSKGQLFLGLMGVYRF